MSNHAGSYLLNSVLYILDKYQVYETLGKEKTLALIGEINKLAEKYDCNPGEILENIGEKLGICYFCWQYGDNFEYGLCGKCK